MCGDPVWVHILTQPAVHEVMDALDAESVTARRHTKAAFRCRVEADGAVECRSSNRRHSEARALGSGGDGVALRLIAAAACGLATAVAAKRGPAGGGGRRTPSLLSWGGGWQRNQLMLLGGLMPQMVQS